VGAIGRRLAQRNGFVVAPFSNAGPDMVASGVGILSAQAGGGYAQRDGTSMATPHGPD